ncbi:MAG: glycosyltransferase family 9 protein, partial [Candidatus Firestonebacteria bacterium]
MKLHSSMFRNSWKALKLYFVVKYLRCFKRKETPKLFELAKVKHVLVIRLDKVGDLVLSLPVFENIKKTLPEAKITALVRSYNSGVLKNNPFVDEVLEYDRPKDREKFKHSNYDLALNLIYDFNLESAYAAYVSRAAHRAGYMDKYSEEFFNIL